MRNSDELRTLFLHDDGSLPEIEVDFADPQRMPSAFAWLVARGARAVASGCAGVWIEADGEARPFSGPIDAELVATGDVKGFHVVLGDIDCGGRIPDLGVLVTPGSLVLDYRMGPHWNDQAIEAFIEMLRGLREQGGAVTAPWWQDSGESAILAAIDGP